MSADLKHHTEVGITPSKEQFNKVAMENPKYTDVAEVET